jgi:hypothetical protein
MTFAADFDVANGAWTCNCRKARCRCRRRNRHPGARYVDHRGNEFWTKGNTATLTREGGGKLDCVRADAPPQAGSPWDAGAAARRGSSARWATNRAGWSKSAG